MSLQAEFSEETSAPDDQGGRLLVLRLTGTLPAGSLGNEPVMEVAAELDRRLGQLSTGAADPAPLGLLIDCLGLDYTFGDVIGVLWVRALRRRLSCIVVARGETKENLASLIAVSLSVPLVETREKAIRLLTAFHDDPAASPSSPL